MEKIKEFIKKLELKRVFKKFLIWFLLITFLEFIFAFIMHDNYTKESFINILFYNGKINIGEVYV